MYIHVYIMLVCCVHYMNVVRVFVATVLLRCCYGVATVFLQLWRERVW